MQIHFEKRDAQLLRYPHGLVYKRSQKERVQNITLTKRGKITSFSRASARNMRMKLVRLPDIDNLWGVTFTFQREAFYQYDIEYFRLTWQKFLKKIKRVVPNWDYMFWRCELTKSGVPHFHTLLKCDSFHNLWEIQNIFLEYIKKYYKVSCPPEVAVNIRSIDGFEEAYSYISSHATKHKQSQLGWQGRQWGILFKNAECKKAFNDSLSKQEIEMISKDNASYVLSKRNEVLFKRVLRKLLYSKLRSNGQFTSVSFRLLKLKGMGFSVRNINVSSKLLASRQSQQCSHFLSSDSATKLMRYVQ